jgi:DNA polymerase-1
MNSWTLDFETFPIGPRPDHFPPKPVGLACKRPNGDAEYWTTWDAMEAVLHEALDDVQGGCRVEFHNGKFDMHVATRWFGVRFQDYPKQVDDTMIMAFLVDPYARSGLKPLADKWLGWAEEEKDACVEWILANKDRLPRFEFVTNSKGEPNGAPTKKNAGAWLAYVPEEIIRPYAIGDVERTHALAKVWRPIIQQCGMQEAYEVEMGVLPIFMDNEEKGIRVDRAGLEEDLETYKLAFAYAEEWLRWRLNAPGLNLDADIDVAAMLESNGVVTDWVKTKNGANSVSKKNLHPDQFNDKQVASVLGYRNRLKTAMKMFMEPWLAQCSAREDGRISTDWNQVQGEGGGTKTGRPSTRNPNLLNISKSFEGKPDGYEHPAFLGLPVLPLVRKYILPNEGEVILKRDFSGQELHIFGHFENGELQAQYAKDPNLDVHNFVGAKAMDIMGREIPRGNVKILNFQGMYGGGVPACAAEMRVSYDEAKVFKDFHDRALPGRKILADTLSGAVQSGFAIRTYGGRLYNRPPFIKRDNGTLSPADYRLINYLIQGSAADVTKRAMLNLVGDADFNSFWMFQVYDEMNISAPIDKAFEQMQVMKRAMESIPLRTTLPTDGEWGFSWGAMNKLKSEEQLKEVLSQ